LDNQFNRKEHAQTMSITIQLPAATPLTPEQQFEQDIATVLKSALEHHHAGNHADAEALYRAILDHMPEHADVLYNLAVLLIQTQRPDDAVPLFETVLGLHPSNGQYWVSYIDALARTNQTQAAWFAVEMAQQRGVRGPAVDGLIERLSHPQGYAAAVLAEASHQARLVPKRIDENAAKTSTSRLGNPTPQDMKQFASLFNKGRHEDAIKHARGLVERYPHHVAAHRSLALALYANGRHVEAIEPLGRTVELEPADQHSRLLLASALQVHGDNVGAERQCRLAIARDPNHAEAHRVLGVSLSAMRRHAESIEACERGVALAPKDANMHGTLGVVLLDDGQIARAEDAFRKALQYNPIDFISHSNLLFCLTHRTDLTPTALFDEHREFDRRHGDPARRLWRPHTNAKDPQKTLRVGLVSGDLFRHAVSSFLEPVLALLAKDPGLQIHVYSTHAREDSTTLRLRGHAPRWNVISGTSDDAFVDKVRADGIDILIDLSGHTGRNRLRAFARKPAPVQASWIGYPQTTGVAAIDYYFANRMPNFSPIDDQFVEKLACLPAAAPFLPDPNSPPVNLLPALHKGYITFGSFNRVSKLRREVIALWARTLHAVPDSKMLLGAMPDDSAVAEITKWFAEEGIGAERLSLHKRSNVSVYLQQHHQVDLCLDTFPYAGGTTTLHALWMGVPTLTLLGETMPGRAGGILMSQVGLEEFIARDKDEFVAKSVAYASDLDALAALRTGMRERCSQSARFRPDMIAASMSLALRHMWQRWCDGLPAEALDTELLAAAAAPAAITQG
jgi:predicted O-linked N-acetylglucosamine transferase (SPINDLY family)